MLMSVRLLDQTVTCAKRRRGLISAVPKKKQARVWMGCMTNNSQGVKQWGIHQKDPERSFEGLVAEGMAKYACHSWGFRTQWKQIGCECTYVCMHMYVWIQWICMNGYNGYVWICEYVYGHIYIYMYVFIHVCICIYMHVCILSKEV